MNIILRNAQKFARKGYLCFWCGKHINKGCVYHNVVGVYDGEFSYTKAHSTCHVLANEMFLEGEPEGLYSPADFMDWVRENNKQL